jgi:hypothetical protein
MSLRLHMLMTLSMGKHFPPTTKLEELPTAHVVALMYFDFFEHTCLPSSTLNPQTNLASPAWMRDVCLGSPAIRSTYNNQRSWYSEPLRQMLDRYEARALPANQSGLRG